MMKRVESVVAAGLCAGCGLCVALADDERVSLGRDGAGFLRPRGLEALSARSSADLLALCPGVNGFHVGLRESAAVTPDELWGPHNFVGTGYSTDDRVRFEGSSGGALTEIARYLLQTGMVAAVVATAGSEAEPLRAETGLVVDPERLLQAAGSKYAPSAPLRLIREMRASDGKIAFIGKPCDVAGLKLVCAQDRGLREKVSHVLSFFCAGVPSERGAEAVLARLGVSRADVREYRNRGRGWPGPTTVTTRDGTTRTLGYREAWGGILSKHLQWRCKLCADGVGEAADIVAGDAWTCDGAGYPLFEEAAGRSLLLSRTAAGLGLLERLRAERRLALAAIDPRAIDRMQPGQSRRRRTARARFLALRLLTRPVPGYPAAEIARFSRASSLTERVATTCGTVWRVIKGRSR